MVRRNSYAPQWVCAAPEDLKAAELSLEHISCGPIHHEDSGSLRSSRSNSFERHNRRKTIIIFDWDDTLFCSSSAAKAMWTRQGVKELEDRVRSILNTSMCLGETMIVTNGVSTWVQDSARRFLPGLLPTLAKISVVSARSLFENAYPGDPYMWKRAAFKHLLTEQGQLYEDGLNLVALGDQRPEIEAAQFVVKSLGDCSRVKTVKLKEAPSVQDLIGQLSKLESELVHIVETEHSFNLCARENERRNSGNPGEHRGTCPKTGWRIEMAQEDRNNWPFSKFLSVATFKDMINMFS